MSIITGLAWFKSSYSSSGDGDCIEVAQDRSAIHVRDSKDKAGPQLEFAPQAWAAFVEFAKQR